MDEAFPSGTSGAPFRAVYRLRAGLAEAEALARDIAVEQTIEFPEDLVRWPGIREGILGKVAWVRPAGPDAFEAAIDYPAETAGRELPQLLNVLFGNTGIKPRHRLVRAELPDEILRLYRGPRFGREGLRDLLGVHDRPLLATAIKPMGLPPAELAEFAYRFALGGMDVIKDDHGLADQTFGRFEERVRRVSEAVLRASRETGRPCLYFPNVTAPADEIAERARRAREAGAGGLLVAPGLAGFDAMRLLADDDGIGLPILSHPAFLGSFTADPEHGISHGVLYGTFARLAGADASIFPNYGGRFSFSREECLEIVEGAASPLGHLRPIFPAPAGGMRLERVPELCRTYGLEAILLVGGDLHRHGPDLAENCRRFARLVAESAAAP